MKWYEEVTKKINLIDFYIKSVESAIARKELDPEDAVGSGGRGLGGKEYIREEKALLFARYRGNKNTPSLSIYKYNDVWFFKDLATGEKGTIFHLARLLYDFESDLLDMDVDARNAIVKKRVNKFLYNKFYTKSAPGEPPKLNYKETNHLSSLKSTRKSEMKVAEITPEITHKGAISYLESRGIKKIPSWLKMLKYTVTITTKKNSKITRGHNALMLENVNGGIVHRNDKFKGNIGPGGITHIDNKKEITVFVEGMFDGLTFYQLFGDEINYVILNSVENIKTNEKYLRENFKNTRNFLGLDNDVAGRKGEALLGIVLGASREIKKIKYPEHYDDPNKMLEDAGRIEIEGMQDIDFSPLASLRSKDIAKAINTLIDDASNDKSSIMRQVGKKINEEKELASSIIEGKESLAVVVDKGLVNSRIAGYLILFDQRYATILPQKYEGLKDLDESMLLLRIFQSTSKVIQTWRKKEQMVAAGNPENNTTPKIPRPS